MAYVAVLFLGEGETVMQEEGAYLPRRRGEPEPQGGRPDPPECLRGMPTLWAFLAYSQWAPGQARALGSITLFRDAGRLKAAFHDKDSGEVGFATLDEEEGLLSQLDRLLRDDRIDWRSSSPRRGRG